MSLLSCINSHPAFFPEGHWSRAHTVLLHKAAVKQSLQLCLSVPWNSGPLLVHWMAAYIRSQIHTIPCYLSSKLELSVWGGKDYFPQLSSCVSATLRMRVSPNSSFVVFPGQLVLVELMILFINGSWKEIVCLGSWFLLTHSLTYLQTNNNFQSLLQIPSFNAKRTKRIHEGVIKHSII